MWAQAFTWALVWLPLALVVGGWPCQVRADETQIEVIRILGRVDEFAGQQYPGAQQHASLSEIERSMQSNIGRFLQSGFTGVTLNEVQNNPFQMDLQYRGFTLSPLLGMPQGMSVYLNGVRFNEPFGDTIHWELIPLTALQQVSLYSGSNPVFGQNSLGGALVLELKDGLDFEGSTLELSAGSHGMVQATIEGGMQIPLQSMGELGFYGVLSKFKEQGWRDFSPSDVGQLLTNLSWRPDDRQRWQLITAASRSDLIGNGAVPYGLMALEGRSAVYTHPDQTENDHWFASLGGDIELDDGLSLALNLYYRHSDTHSLNGDDSDFEPCESDDESLCDEDDEPVSFVDASGNPLSITLPQLGLEADELDGLNNRTNTAQDSGGVSAELIVDYPLGALPAQWVFGAGMSRADIRFGSDTEFALLLNDPAGDASSGSSTANRSTVGAGIYDGDARVLLDTSRSSHFGFAAASVALGETVKLSGSLRFDMTRVEMQDLAPGDDGNSLDGDHRFELLSPALGLIWQPSAEVSASASWGRSGRAPTPVELSCADPDAPCKLPNGFVSDPPLEQVVTETFELGLKFTSATVEAELAAFYATNHDDIIFQQAGGLPSEGYFANVGDTLRRGIDVSLGKRWQHWYLGLKYSYLDASFRTPYTSFSPNNRLGGNREVNKGDRLPGLPEHSAGASIEWQRDPAMVGLDIHYQSGQYYRGDEANENAPLDGFTRVDLRASYRLSPGVSLYARVDNLFDARYETFGSYGESEEVLGEMYPGFDDVRFVGPGAPRSFVVGVRVNF